MRVGPTTRAPLVGMTLALASCQFVSGLSGLETKQSTGGAASTGVGGASMDGAGTGFPVTSGGPTSVATTTKSASATNTATNGPSSTSATATGPTTTATTTQASTTTATTGPATTAGSTTTATSNSAASSSSGGCMKLPLGSTCNVNADCCSNKCSTVTGLCCSTFANCNGSGATTGSVPP